ncbi:DUF1833 family protein [Pseudodesulfovibrio pelocollis]|uniref:DUF1833 family protein n=1 Tax=Pseudodesulfovibrio pelocollis TaxID=3051432 RepID=UPI00255B2F1B|nr:DUF1833 family protein [Pseudodesulfovibrio sp. SB368]
MSQRNQSPAAVRAMLSQETGEVPLVCLVLDHPTLPEPYRFVGSKKPLTHQGHEFIGYPFGGEFPADSPDTVSKVNLVIDNVDREIVTTLRSISEGPDVTMFAVLASSPDHIEFGPFEMKLVNAEYDQLEVVGELSWEDMLNEPYPAHQVTPSLFPGAF